MVMKKIFLIISVAFTLIFIGCGDGSKEEAKKLLTQILTLVGIPQDLVVTICQDKNDNGSCDSGEIQAKIAINKGDLVDDIWKKVEFNANGEYILKNYDPTKNIIMEIEDKKNLKYDNGQLTFKYNPDTKELSVLQAIIDADFLRKANMLPGEKVTIINLNNGNRFETYIIEKPAGSKSIEINGGGARLCLKGDRLIIISYGIYDEEELKDYKPIVLIMDEDNGIKECRNCQTG